MTITAPPAAPERKPRCRVLDVRSNRCENPVIDDDPNAPQICPRHALEGAQLLQSAGAILITFITPDQRRPA